MADRTQHAAPARPLATVTLANALDHSAPLASLMLRLRDSRARLEALTGVIPSALRDQVRAGPLDEQGWTLLAGSGAVAAKLRQLLPLFELTLAEKGWQPTVIKVRIQSA